MNLAKDTFLITGRASESMTLNTIQLLTTAKSFDLNARHSDSGAAAGVGTLTGGYEG